jgi:pimeloyl-ACP methyl ester carboxylesterase
MFESKNSASELCETCHTILEEAPGDDRASRPCLIVMKNHSNEKTAEPSVHPLCIPIGSAQLEGELRAPAGAAGLVLFAHGSGSSRHSPRNQFVARVMRASGNATLLFDLLTSEEERQDYVTGTLRFDIALLASRLVLATRYLMSHPGWNHLNIGYFGSSTGGAAALMAAAQIGQSIGAVVSRGGRPDLAPAELPLVPSPTLLIVGEYDDVVLRLNQEAFAKLRCEKELKIVPRATHLFEEEGTLEEVARLAAAWFRRHLHSRPAP